MHHRHTDPRPDFDESPPHDLEAFLGARRPPGRLDAPDDVPQAIEHLAPALPADLDIVGPGVRRPGRIRGGQAAHEQAVVGELGRFGQCLGEAEPGLEAAGGKVALVVKLAGVSDPLIDEEQAGTVLVENVVPTFLKVLRNDVAEEQWAGRACRRPEEMIARYRVSDEIG